MSASLDWERDGADWPNREASRFVEAGGLRWHVQVMGEGPDLLLLHGTGAASHSFAELGPHLADRFRVIIPDLPGHGFTETPRYEQLSLPSMAAATGELLRQLEASPVLAAGHSAGAAILVRMSLDERIHPRLLVSLNGAILPLQGVQGRTFAPIAKAFIMSGFMSRLFAWRARNTGLVQRLMDSTGSTISEDQLRPYATLAQHADHVDAAIGMMANWDLKAMEPDLADLEPALLLVVGAGDRMIPPSHGLRLRRILPKADLKLLPDLGHLAHEERPEEVADLMIEAYDHLTADKASVG